MARTLVIGDLHLPAHHPGYLQFCLDLYDQWNCDTTVFIGDVVDLHSISFHEKELDTPNPIEEYELSMEALVEWRDAFPKAYVTIGNHDERVHRKAKATGIPSHYLKSYSELYGTPKWTWCQDVTIDDVHYWHGTGRSGIAPARNAAISSMMSTVIGHCHSVAGLHWIVGPNRRVFGMDTGCGVDPDHPAMRYGAQLKSRPVIAAGVVIDGIPYHEICPTGRGELYNRSNFA